MASLYGGDDAASEAGHTGVTVDTLKVDTVTLCVPGCPCRDPRWGTVTCKFCRRPRRSASTLTGKGPHMPWRRERGRECGICPWVIDGDPTLSALLFSLARASGSYRIRFLVVKYIQYTVTVSLE